jgi:hypothetical protein
MKFKKTIKIPENSKTQVLKFKKKTMKIPKNSKTQVLNFFKYENSKKNQNLILGILNNCENSKEFKFWFLKF